MVVYEGDSAEDLAEEFCNEFGLNVKQKLTDMLKGEMEGLLDKIEEEDSVQDSV